MDESKGFQHAGCDLGHPSFTHHPASGICLVEREESLNLVTNLSELLDVLR